MWRTFCVKEDGSENATKWLLLANSIQGCDQVLQRPISIAASRWVEMRPRVLLWCAIITIRCDHPMTIVIMSNEDRTVRWRCGAFSPSPVRWRSDAPKASTCRQVSRWSDPLTPHFKHVLVMEIGWTPVHSIDVPCLMRFASNARNASTSPAF